MSERYWISGAQLGMSLACVDVLREHVLKDGEPDSSENTILRVLEDVLNHVSDTQFVGEYSPGDVIIIRRGDKGT